MNDKQYKITMDNERRIVRLEVRGEVVKEVGESIIAETRTKAAENKYNILCDVRKAKVKVNLSDWFYLPRNLDAYKKTQTVSTAILITPGGQETEYSFFETVANNIGINIKIFLEENEALEWLGKLCWMNEG